MRRRQAGVPQLLGEKLLGVGVRCAAVEDHRVRSAQAREHLGSERGVEVRVRERHRSLDVRERELGGRAGVDEDDGRQRHAQRVGRHRVEPLKVDARLRRLFALAPPREPAAGQYVGHGAEHEGGNQVDGGVTEEVAAHGREG